MTDSRALAEEIREFTAMKYAGDCKCGKCQLVPRALVERIYHTLNGTGAVASEPAADLADELDQLLEAFLYSSADSQIQAINEVTLHKALWDNKAGIIAHLRTGAVAQRPPLTVEDVYANCYTTMIGFARDLKPSDINFICDQISRKVILASPAQPSWQPNTCYLERSAVRSILIGQPDENLHITELVLAEVDALPIVAFGDAADEDHPDCTTTRERELYEALMGLSSAVMARRREWDNWVQGGVKIAPVVRHALRLDASTVPSTEEKSHDSE